MKHAAWDGGAISEHELFQALSPQKTVKTRCGMRVKMSSVNNTKPDCPKCVSDIERERVALAEINTIVTGIAR